MTFAKTVAEIKRNTRVLEEIGEASDFRIAFKTKDGWKRLRASTPVQVEALRCCAGGTVSARLDKLVPAATDSVVGIALDDLIDLLNER